MAGGTIKSELDKSLERFILEAKMELLNEIYHVGNKQETYTNLVVKLNEIGKKLYRSES